MSNTKLAVDNRSVSVFVPLKPKANKVYIPPFKRNHKEIIYFARLYKGESSDVKTEISKLMSKLIGKLKKKSIFVSTYHLCGVVGHIRPKCIFWGKNQNLRLDLLLGILMLGNLDPGW